MDILKDLVKNEMEKNLGGLEGIIGLELPKELKFSIGFVNYNLFNLAKAN